MKRKILNMAMNKTREYDNIKHKWIKKYTFLNPTTLQVVNMIMDELAKKYDYVKNETVEKFLDSPREFYEGSIICQML